MKNKLSDAVIDLENIIFRKRDGLNEQWIDDEILAFISVYRNGSKEYRDYAKKWLQEILVNSGMVNKKRDLILDDWSDEE